MTFPAKKKVHYKTKQYLKRNFPRMQGIRSGQIITWYHSRNNQVKYTVTLLVNTRQFLITKYTVPSRYRDCEVVCGVKAVKRGDLFYPDWDDTWI